MSRPRPRRLAPPISADALAARREELAARHARIMRLIEEKCPRLGTPPPPNQP